MYYCITTDISSDKIRRKVVKLCKQCGLRRMQRSVFVGKTSLKRIQKTEQEIRALLNPLSDALSIIPMDKAAWKAMLTFGNMPNKKQLVLEQKVLYF